VANKALRVLLKLHRGQAFAFAPKDLAIEMNRIAVEEDLATEEKPFTNAKRVG
jgi:hypothetical protein